jgi:hypothetical protein
LRYEVTADVTPADKIDKLDRLVLALEQLVPVLTASSRAASARAELPARHSPQSLQFEQKEGASAAVQAEADNGDRDDNDYHADNVDHSANTSSSTHPAANQSPSLRFADPSDRIAASVGHYGDRRGPTELDGNHRRQSNELTTMPAQGLSHRVVSNSGQYPAESGRWTPPALANDYSHHGWRRSREQWDMQRLDGTEARSTDDVFRSLASQGHHHTLFSSVHSVDDDTLSVTQLLNQL